MWYWYYLLPTVFVLSLLIGKYRDYIKEKAIDLVVAVVLRASAKMYSKQDSAEVHKRYMKIPYTYHGTKYHIYVPFSRVDRRKMLNTKCVLVGKDGSHIDITQQPGCCYLVSVDMLEGKEIIVENFDEKINKTFTGNDIPIIE